MPSTWQIQNYDILKKKKTVAFLKRQRNLPETKKTNVFVLA